AHSDRRVGTTRPGPVSGGFCFPLREADHSPLARQSLAPVYAAEAGESRFAVGDVSGFEKNQRQLVQEGGRRSESGLRPEGPRAGCQPGGLHELRPGAEASRREETRSRGASKTTIRKPVSTTEARLNGINGITRNQWVFLSC